ncbi:retrovirus-related pol polyprotein from transposon TNT 1-94 [Tanacetum coccineum]
MSIQLDTTYGRRVIRRIGNWLYAFSCEELALIRRISLCGYDILDNDGINVTLFDVIRVILGKTPYELLRGRKPTLDYFRVFGSKCFILNTKYYLTNFDPKSYEGVFLGYSQNIKAYTILNKHTRKIEESLNVTFDETPPPSKTSPLVDDDLDEEEEAIKIAEKKILENDIEDETLEVDEIVNIKESRIHPLENVIRNLTQRTLRSQAQNQSNFFSFIPTIEPKNVNEALMDESWLTMFGS